MVWHLPPWPVQMEKCTTMSHVTTAIRWGTLYLIAHKQLVRLEEEERMLLHLDKVINNRL